MQTEQKQILDLKLAPQAAAGLDIGRILNESKLVHLHPHWFVDQEKKYGDVLRVELRDYETDKIFSLGLHLDALTVVNAGEDEERQMIMRVKIMDYGASELLFFTDHEKTRVQVIYRDAPARQEVEQEVLLWIRALQEYLRLYTTTTPYTLFFRILMNKMMLQMNPSQRNISIMITKITIIELLVIVILVVGYVYFS